MNGRIVLLWILAAVLIPEYTSPASEIVDVHSTQITVPAGGSVSATVTLTIEDGFHIQAHTTPGEFMVPTSLRIESDSAIASAEVIFPEGREFIIDGTDDHLDVYDGQVVIQIRVTSRHAEMTGKTALRAVLTYQACTTRACLSPKVIDFSIGVNVGERWQMDSLP